MIVSKSDRWEREAKLRALRDTLNASIAKGGHNTLDHMTKLLDQRENELAKEGY
jgi:antitoxin ParD1/3/4